jgi:hypothetical protein
VGMGGSRCPPIGESDALGLTFPWHDTSFRLIRSCPWESSSQRACTRPVHLDVMRDKARTMPGGDDAAATALRVSHCNYQSLGDNAEDFRSQIVGAAPAPLR